MFVTHMGALYKMTKRSFKQYLEYRAAHGNQKPIDHFVSVSYGTVLDLTDLTADEAAAMLKGGIR
jgi:hypothetical protein